MLDPNTMYKSQVVDINRETRLNYCTSEREKNIRTINGHLVDNFRLLTFKAVSEVNCNWLCSNLSFSLSMLHETS